MEEVAETEEDAGSGRDGLCEGPEVRRDAESWDRGKAGLVVRGDSESQQNPTLRVRDSFEGCGSHRGLEAGEGQTRFALKSTF